MFVLGPLGFVTPWLLLGLALLPLIWLILRAMPPAPKVQSFAAIRLLAGLRDADPVARHTPWWLMLLRMSALAALIFAFAGPVWRPAPNADSQGPVLIVVDGGWAAAPAWAEIQNRAAREFERAAAAGQPAALLLADGRAEDVLPFASGGDLAGRIRAARPEPWETRYPPDPEAALAAVPAGRLQTIWLSDGLDHGAARTGDSPHASRAQWLSALQARGPVRVIGPQQPVASLMLEAGEKPMLIHRSTASLPDPVIRAIGPDPQGVPRELARLSPGPGDTQNGITRREIAIDLPSELRNRVTRFEIEGVASAGAVVLADDRVRRRKVALVGDDRATEGQELLSPIHYLREAVAPTSDLIEGTLADVLQAAPDVIILVDQLQLPGMDSLEEWVQNGGLLIRFAGPRMAASDRLVDAPLLPVRLRQGGRDVGGALSWGQPRKLAPFDQNGPFAGLAGRDDITIRAQLLPEPTPDLQSRTIAQLTDQTPLVTREWLGEGQVVLFHTTANAEWSNLPLSGLFVQMLERLIQSARTPEASSPSNEASQPYWIAQTLLDGFGRPSPANTQSPVSAKDFATGPAPNAPAGIYTAAERRAALNAGNELRIPQWPGAQLETSAAVPGLALKGWSLGLVCLLLALDALLSAMLLPAKGGPGASRGPKRAKASV